MKFWGETVSSDRRPLLQHNQFTFGDNPAFVHLGEKVEELSTAGANHTDLLFLKSLLESTSLRSLIQVQDKLEQPIEPVSATNTGLLSDIRRLFSKHSSKEGQELCNIVNKPHFLALVSCHDTIAESYSSLAPLARTDSTESAPNMTADSIRVIGLRKSPNEPLGLTVELDQNGNLVVARILAGGMIDKQGLLSVGDIILEVNQVPVDTPEALVTQVTKAKDSLNLKVAPSPEDTAPITGLHNGIPSSIIVYMRALFDYDPNDDTLLPCKEIGLAFGKGDILQILNMKDPNWWQARRVGWAGPAGLVPSQELEERRKAFVKPEADFVHKIGICGTRVSKKKKKVIYESKTNSEFDKAELLLYEEVTRMPPFRRKTLVLIGTRGVGRRTLKNRLINSDPEKFGGVTPYTSRPRRDYEEDGKNYWFLEREDMEREIREHRFLEYGEHGGNLYGTSLDSIREVIRHGRMCVLDCNPTALKILHNAPEFMPYVIFVASPGMESLKHLYYERRPQGLMASNRNLNFERSSSIRYSSRRARTLESLASIYEEEDLMKTLEDSSCMQRTCEKYIDLTIVNEDFDVTFRKVVQALETLSTEHQWVPVNWVY